MHGNFLFDCTDFLPAVRQWRKGKKIITTIIYEYIELNVREGRMDNVYVFAGYYIVSVPGG